MGELTIPARTPRKVAKAKHIFALNNFFTNQPIKKLNYDSTNYLMTQIIFSVKIENEKIGNLIR